MLGYGACLADRAGPTGVRSIAVACVVARSRFVHLGHVWALAGGKALAALLPLAATGAVAVRIAGRAPLVEAATVYQDGSSKSGSRGRWILVP